MIYLCNKVYMFNPDWVTSSAFLQGFFYKLCFTLTFYAQNYWQNTILVILMII